MFFIQFIYSSFSFTEAAPGCKAPVIRINPPPKRNNHVELEADVDEEETTPSYLPEDLTTTDADSFVESIHINVSPENAPAINPYQIDDVVSAVHEPTVNEHHSETSEFHQEQRNEQINKKRRGSNRRRRKENENGHGRMVGVGNRGARYKRDISVKSVEIGKWKERPIDIDDTYYIDVSDLYKTKSLDKSLKKRLRNKLRKEMAGNLTHIDSQPPSEEPIDREDDGSTNIFQKMVNLFRVKRKSGKTTGALSRPKGGGDSSSKSTSRKGDKSKWFSFFHHPFVDVSNGIF